MKPKPTKTRGKAKSTRRTTGPPKTPKPAAPTDNLTPKQRLFVAEYCATFNASEAARRAGYSEKNARRQGWENLQNPTIKAAIDTYLDGRIMRPAEVLARLSDHASSDIGQFLDVRPDGSFDFDFTQVFTGTANTRSIKKIVIKPNPDGLEIAVEMYDSLTALTTLAKHHKLLIEKVEVDWRKEAEANGLPANELFEELVKTIAAKSSRS